MSLRVGFLYFVVVSLLLAMDVVASIQVATTGTYYTRVLEGFVNKHFFKFPKDHIQHQIWKDIWTTKNKRLSRRDIEQK
jgi:hypothetical protein